MEQELLSIVEILKEYRAMLVGQPIIVYTDLNSISCFQFQSLRVIRWRLLLDKFDPTIKYIKDEANEAADALFQFPLVKDAAVI